MMGFWVVGVLCVRWLLVVIFFLLSIMRLEGGLFLYIILLDYYLCGGSRM